MIIEKALRFSGEVEGMVAGAMAKKIQFEAEVLGGFCTFAVYVSKDAKKWVETELVFPFMYSGKKVLDVEGDHKFVMVKLHVESGEGVIASAEAVEVEE